MPPVPRLTACELLQKLHRLGFIDVRQRGSHLLIHDPNNPGRYAIIPIHSQHVMPLGTLKHILNSAQVTVEMLEEA
ncbi:MAG: type II toxin-antitoxin system HicA family toxin [Firmicutes bacterium]|jgi:predicted RNA binding protein YcfA (HicA-like mRNA interferase family)|nr:type II toxin-antitoxin system HicA family toxin [Bacillota bacterium]MCL5063474.1 type II toxin-antitoxin system HicA family toxin [Bacillota bacterium]